MIDPSPPQEKIPSWFCAALIVLVVALFTARNLPWHLDNYDQAKQAFTSFEMIAEGQWWFQHTPNGSVATKPPLAGWISAAIYRLTGGRWWEGAWRIPAFLSALLLLAVLWKAGRALSGSNVGSVLATGAFALNVFTPRLATLVRTDMLLTFFIFLVGYLVLEKVRANEAWTTRERWLVFTFVLGSILTKGPIAYAFLLPGLIAYHFCARRFTMLNYAWSGWWSWFAPLIPFAVWAGVGWSMSSEFYEEVVRKEFLGRFDMGERPIHKHQPVYFYVGHLLLRFVPWSLMLVAFVSVKRVRVGIRHDPVLLWLICWSLGGLLVMSAVPSKRFDRIFPVVPPLSLLLVTAARHLPRRQWKGQPIHRLTMIATALAACISTTYAGYEITTGVRENRRGLVAFGRTVQRETGGRHDRLAIVSGKDEGMLLYIGQTRFSGVDRAIVAWRSGRIDWLVIPERELEKQASRLGSYERRAMTGSIPKKSSAYVLIRRVGDPGQAD